MKYLSTSEIAKKWGVTRKTVNRYAMEGRIEGAYIVGKTWMIPENAEKDACSSAADTHAEEFRFPLYAYRDFYALKDRLKGNAERKLYAAFENAIAGNFHIAYRLAAEVCSATDSIPMRITCLYLMCRCMLYLKNYAVFMRHVLEMHCLFGEDFAHKTEMRTLLIDIETYYKGFQSLIEFTFAPTDEFSEDVLPMIITMSLYRQIILAMKDREQIDTTAYEVLLKDMDRKGFVWPSVLLRSELAFIYYSRQEYDTAYYHAMNAYKICETHDSFIMLVELYSVSPKIVDKALEHYGIVISPGFRKLTREFKRAYIGLMIYLKRPKVLYSFSGDDFEYIVYAIRKYTNKEIAAEKNISENAVSQRYTKLYNTFSAANKKELIHNFIEGLGTF